MKRENLKKILWEAVAILIVLLIVTWAYKRDIKVLDDEVYYCNSYIERLGNSYVKNYLDWKKDNSTIVVGFVEPVNEEKKINEINWTLFSDSIIK